MLGWFLASLMGGLLATTFFGRSTNPISTGRASWFALGIIAMAFSLGFAIFFGYVTGYEGGGDGQVKTVEQLKDGQYPVYGQYDTVAGKFILLGVGAVNDKSEKRFAFVRVEGWPEKANLAVRSSDGSNSRIMPRYFHPGGSF